MKNILLILDQTNKKYIKYFLAAYLLEAIAFTLLILSNLHGALIIILAMFAIFAMHIWRMKENMKDGVITRMLLLPVKKSAVVWSEFIFTVASYAMFFVVLYAVLYFAFWLQSPEMSISSFILYCYKKPGITFFLPFSDLQFLFLMFYVFLYSIETISFAFDTAVGQNKGYLNSFIFLSLWLPAYDPEAHSLFLFLFICSCMFIYLYFCLRHLNKLLHFKRKKVVS